MSTRKEAMGVQLTLGGGGDAVSGEQLGGSFQTEAERQNHFRTRLGEELFRESLFQVEGSPISSKDVILDLSDPPGFTAAPNPFIAQFIALRGHSYNPTAPYQVGVLTSTLRRRDPESGYSIPRVGSSSIPSRWRANLSALFAFSGLLLVWTLRRPGQVQKLRTRRRREKVGKSQSHCLPVSRKRVRSRTRRYDPSRP
jgi:hypothetical protein